MKIGIDARMYGPKQGGLGRYTEQLILHLERIETYTDETERDSSRHPAVAGTQNDKPSDKHENEFVIFLRRENWNEYTPAKPNFRKILADIPWYGWAEQIKLPGMIKKEKVDLMHFPHWNVPLRYNNPFVVTIHDLLLIHYPTRSASTLGPLTYWLKNFLFRRVLAHASKKAKHIFTVSEFSKQDIIKTLKVLPEKVDVTYLAPFINKDKRYAIGDKNILQNLGIKKSFVLYVGVAFPHKNLKRLLSAWELFQKKYGTSHQLVLAGKENYFYKKLRLSPIAYRLSQSVIFTDFVSDETLANLYRQASLYIFPSLYEGFGLPPLEAMQYDVPVAASNDTCLPEILESAALYFDPNDAEAIAEAIHTGLTDEKLRKKLLTAGQKLIQKYSWANLAKKTLNLYQKSG